MTRAAYLLMAAYFVFATLVQINDPDPARWMIVYGTASALSAWAAFRTVPPWLPALHGAAALLWAMIWLPGAITHSFSELFGSWKMMSTAMEEGREELGLLVVVLWMGFVTWRARRTARRR